MAFCLVSSDSDFTRLAQRLTEDGLMVYGIYERKKNRRRSEKRLQPSSSMPDLFSPEDGAWTSESVR